MEIHFPQIKERSTRKAKVVAYSDADDLVLLQVIDGPVSLSAKQVAVLGDPEEFIS